MVKQVYQSLIIEMLA